MEENGNDDISTLPRLFAFANFVIYFSSFFGRKNKQKTNSNLEPDAIVGMVVKHFHSGRVHDEEKIVPFLWRGAFYVKNPNEGESPFLYHFFERNSDRGSEEDKSKC